MKKSIRILALVLSVVMLLALAACAETPTNTDPSTEPSTTGSTEPSDPGKTVKEQILEYFTQLKTATAPGLNTYHSSWDDVVAYLTTEGVISADAEQVDMLTTEGYLQDNTGGQLPTYAFADKAVDFGGVYLCWWNLAEPTEALDCYTGMLNNSGNIVIMGGAAVVKFVMTNSGSFAIGFADDYDEAAKTAAVDAFNAIDNKAYSLAYMTSAADLAMALKNEGLLAAADIAGNVNLNQKYAYTTMKQDWVGYDVSDSGWGEPYEATAYAKLATEAYAYGNVSILYFAASDRGENSWYPNIANVYAALSENATSGLYCQLEMNGQWTEYKVDAEGNYSAEGTALTISVDDIYGSYAIIVNE